MKRILSMILVLVMLLGMMPMTAFATEGTQETEAVEVVTEPTEAPEEETTPPAEDTEETEPSDEEEETESPDEEEDAEPSEPSESEEEPEVIHEHDYEAVVTDPTCTEQGYTTYTCECGDSYVDDYMDAADHNYAEGTCTVCGAAASNPYAGKTIACIGDSITYGVGVIQGKTDYVTLLAKALEMNYIRLGASGTTLCTNGARTCNIDKLTEGKLQGADVVTIAMGINDFCAAGKDYYKLGDINSTDSSTIYGAMRMWCERIAALQKTDSLKDTEFYFVTPLITSWNNSVTSARNWEQSKVNIHGYTLRDLCNAIIEVAALYDVAVIDLNLISGLYYVNAQDNNVDVFGGDGVHPGDAGHAMMAAALEDALLKHYLLDDHDHSYGSWLVTTYPDCESGEEKRVCQICRAAESRALAGKGHSYTESVTTEPTCVDKGIKTFICHCGNRYTEEIAAKGHSHKSVVTAPTCTEQGYTTYTCECGDSYVADYVDAEGAHDFTDWHTTKEATYQAAGEESRECKKCSHVEFRSVELEVVTSGNVGYGTPYTDDVTYTLYADGTMVIAGSGKVYCSDWRGDYQPYKDYRTQVKKLIIEEGITTTAGGCFAHFYNLETVSLPDSLTKIDGNAFMSSFSGSVTSVTIPKTVTYIGAYSYGFYYGQGGTTFADVIIENPNVKIVDNKAVFNAGNNLANLTLYSYGTNNNVSAYAAKYGCKYVDLENYETGVYSGVEYLYYDGVLELSAAQNDATIAGEDAPWNAEKDDIKKIVIESGITGISANAFKDYYNLESVEVNNEIRYVGDGAFATTENCDLALTLMLPRSVKHAGTGIFAGRKNVSLTAYLGSAAAEIDAPGVNLNIKKQFKLMLIGNSYSEDASSGSHTQSSQLLDILQAMLGEDAEITLALLSSGGKGMHWHATQAEQGNAAYSFKVITTANPAWKSMGSYTSANALAWTDWDAVSLQPYNINVSTGQESVPYPETTDPKFYHIEDSSTYLLDHVARYAPDADVYFYMHWAQTSGTVLNAVLSSYNKAAAFMPRVLAYAGTESGAQFKTIIPVGLSIQNARTTYLALLSYNPTAYADKNLNLQTDAQIGLQRDGGHVSFNIGRYIAGLTFAEMIIPQEWRVDGYVLPEIRITESVGKLPKEYSEIAQKSVLAAVNGWKNGSLAVTNIEGYAQDPTVAASELLKATKFRLNDKEESLAAQLESAVLAELPADFAVSEIAINEDAMTADVTIRFGYTFATVTVSYTKSAPVITQQPESVQQEIGKKFAITVKAEGEGLKYQWYVKEAGAKAFKLSVNKTASYAYTMQSYMHNRQVYCVITDANGNSVQTETASITRPPQALKIIEQPQDAQQEIGQKFSIKPAVQGDALTYQWYYKESYMKGFAVSSNKTSAYAYTMQSYMHNRSVYCVITDQYGNQVTTDVATITRPPVELKILNQPADVYAEKGEKFSIKADVQGDGLTYQWYYRESYQKKFSASSNKTSAYAFSMQSYMNNRSVYCVITDQYGNQVQTEVVTIHLEK